ncbi:MAG: metallophosphoesterase, partial [Promethearchaeota archaeon]
MEQNIEQKEKLSLISRLGRYEKIERDSEVSYKIYMNADNFRVVQTTDMHFSNINFRHKKMLKKVDALIRSIGPNLIVNTGDYFGNVAPFYAKLLLKELEKYTSYPWAFAWGNHDLDLYQYKLFFKNYERIEQLLESLPKSLYLRTGDYFDQFKNKSLDKDEKERKACIEPIEKGLKKEGDKYIVVDKGSFKRYDGFYGGNYLLKIFNSSKKHVWNLF